MEGKLNLVELMAGVRHEERCCDLHGRFSALVLANGKKSECPKCFDIETGRIDRERMQADRSENERRAHHDRLAATGIPAIYLGKSLESYRIIHPDSCQRSVLGAARSYVEDFPIAGGRTFGLIGATGTGKTHIAAAIASGVLAKGYSVLFTSSLAMLRSVKESYSQTSHFTEEEMISRFCRPDLLVIDDFGVKVESETDRAIIYEVVNRRNLDGKSHALTSNESTELLIGSMGSRVISRLLENNGKFFACKWDDYRMTRGAA